ncbi:hypothetical protein E2N92_00055 [Methanofollis formosanus]|uniref:DUF7982 domain-containing protein n=1 Tax=Methanofollis formosanus TaxID=299308 RepID=A0A8G0ZVZ8_9EURY|nr:hypothetical protein [Methanofollis formosanus]QYZ77929.1 hypothetical protein E2N92_00055 [Methanofollis formosanus]
MKKNGYNDYFMAGAALIAAAALVLTIAYLTNRGDLTSATLAMSGIASFVGGVFLLTLSKGEPFDPGYVGALPAAGTINLSRVASDLGLMGDGVYLPHQTKDSPILQFIPAGSYHGATIREDFSFAMADGSEGLVFLPMGLPLLEQLKHDAGLRIPAEEANIFSCIQEVCSDVLEVAEIAAVERSGDAVVVTMGKFRLLSCCAAVRAESPKCCTMVGCPVCSLVACILTEGFGKPCSLSKAQVDEGHGDLTLVYSFPE